MREQIEKQAIEEMANVIQHSFQMLLPHDMALVSAEYLCNEGYRKQEWISVADRLPTWEDGKVLIYTTHGISIAQRTTSERWQGDLAKPKWITHWMPLPEPPKMKGGAE